MPLTINEAPVLSFIGGTSYFLGTMHLKIQVGQLSCLDDFYVMSRKSLVLSVILGTPWLKKYKALLDWVTNAIHFKQEDGYVS